MHELGIVFYVVEQIEKVANENQAKKVVGATLELGEVSGVVYDYFMDLWNWTIQKHELLKDCQLELITLKAITYCENCGKTYDTVLHGRICPHCKSDKTYLLTGNEINLKNIKIT